MTEQANPNQPGDPREAEPGRGAPGSQWAVQTAQTTDVNPDDAKIPTDADADQNLKEVKAVEEQEAGTGMSTTEGYVIDEAGRLDNYAIEPPIRVEGQDT